MKNEQERNYFAAKLILDIDERMKVLLNYAKENNNIFIAGFCKGMNDFLIEKLKELKE